MIRNEGEDMTTISVILGILTGQMVCILISFLLISKLFSEIHSLNVRVKFLLKDGGTKYWDSSK